MAMWSSLRSRTVKASAAVLLVVAATSFVGVAAPAGPKFSLGVLRRDESARYKSPVELRLMRAIKRALDPHGLMNPGKVLPEADPEAYPR